MLLIAIQTILPSLFTGGINFVIGKIIICALNTNTDLYSLGNVQRSVKRKRGVPS